MSDIQTRDSMSQRKTISNNFMVNTVEDGLSPNQNILLGTVFDRGIDAVKSNWYSTYWSKVSVDSTKTIDGKKCLLLDFSSSSSTAMFGLRQNVLSRINVGTWYTLSFYYYSETSFELRLPSIDSVTKWVDISESVYVDGVATTVTDNRVIIDMPASTDGIRHTVTFKTVSEFPNNYAYVSFMFAPYNKLYLCMPKLEEGDTATPYIANENDLIGETGSQGERGKVGRFFYYAGAFDSSDSTTTFTVSDAEAPFFSYNGNHWVYSPTENGSFTMAAMGNPSSSSSSWNIMTNDFKYLITEAIFSSFAKLGGFVINDDWMLSRDGIIYDTSGVAYTIDSSSTITIDGVTYTRDNAYTKFDATHPDSSSGNVNFCPNFCVDSATGVLYSTNGVFKGEISATGWKSIDLNDGNHGNKNEGFTISQGGTYSFNSNSTYYTGSNNMVNISIATDSCENGTIITLVDNNDNAYDYDDIYYGTSQSSLISSISTNPITGIIDVVPTSRTRDSVSSEYAKITLTTSESNDVLFRGIATSAYAPNSGGRGFVSENATPVLHFRGGAIQLIKTGGRWRILSNASVYLILKHGNNVYSGTGLAPIYPYYAFVSSSVGYELFDNVNAFIYNGRQIRNEYYNV